MQTINAVKERVLGILNVHVKAHAKHLEKHQDTDYNLWRKEVLLIDRDNVVLSGNGMHQKKPEE